MGLKIYDCYFISAIKIFTIDLIPINRVSNFKALYKKWQFEVWIPVGAELRVILMAFIL